MAFKPSTVLTLRQSLWGIASICASLSLSGLTHAQDKPVVKIEAYGDPFGQAQLAPKKQARVYAYRSASSTKPGTISRSSSWPITGMKSGIRSIGDRA